METSPRKTTKSSLCVLYLKQNHSKFNAPSKRESIFFDECNREILSLTSNRVVVQQTDVSKQIELNLPAKKKVLSIKFNPTRTILAYHIERNIVEFVNLISSSSGDTLEERRYVQSSRAKNSKLIGFIWTGPSEIVLITDLSVEYYHVDSNRHRLTYVKLFQSVTNWFVYQPHVDAGQPGISSTRDQDVSSYSLLIVSTGSLGNSMQPYLFKSSQIVRLQKFEVEGNWNDGDKLELFERSITIGRIYGYIRLLVLQHESLNVKSRGAQIVLYTINPTTGITAKTHTLDLDTSGRFAINILDNLVIVHDQPSKTSFIFDIAIDSTEKSDCPRHYVSLIDSRPIRSLELESSITSPKRKADMYSLNWVFFQPNFIVDAKLGLISTLQIDLEAIQEVLQDNMLLLSFLARRENSEQIILNKCNQIVCDSYKLATGARRRDQESVGHRMNPLVEISSVFEILSYLMETAPELNLIVDPTVPETSRNQQQPDEFGYRAIICQEDVERTIFRQFIDEEDVQNKPSHFHFVSSILFEFIFALRCRDGKNVHFCIYEQLVRCLARGKRFFQIVQMIRSEILQDSKHLACLLISLRVQYKPALQLGLDMFYRLPSGPPPEMLTELMQE